MKNFQNQNISTTNNQFSSPLKKINLQQYQKPKTLIVVHYKGKRISVPLLGDCKNLTQMLYHHIDKFQQTVMKSQPNWQKLSNKKIVCFCSSSSSNQQKQKIQGKLIHEDNSSSRQKDNNKQNSLKQIKKKIEQYLKYADGDLKIDILLSLIRIQNSENQSDFSVELDITKYYKYMEIQPFYVFEKEQKHKKNQIHVQRQKRQPEQCLRSQKFKDVRIKNGLNINICKEGKYFFYRLLESNCIKNVYLARNVKDGYFYEVKVYRAGLQLGQKQANFILNVMKKDKLQKQGQNSQKFNIDFNHKKSLKKNAYDFCYWKNDPILSSLKDSQIHLISSSEQLSQNRSQEQQEQEQQFSYEQQDNEHRDRKNFYFHQMKNAKYLVIITKYNPKGKLQQKIRNKKSISNIAPHETMNELLNYLKQLIRIVHTLHEKYFIIHRNITPENIEIDEFGNLKLVEFASYVKYYQQKNVKVNVNESIQKLRYPRRLFQNKSHQIFNQFNEKDEFLRKQKLLRPFQQFQGNDGEWYDIGIYTPAQVKNRSKNGYDKMVDYYSVGMIMKQLFDKEQHHILNDSRYTQDVKNELNNVKANSAKVTAMLMNKIISGLISQNIQQRQEIVNQLIQGMLLSNSSNMQVKEMTFNQKKSSQLQLLLKKNEKNIQEIQQDFLSKEIQILNLNELWLGKFIPFVSTKCVENEIDDGQNNGILHEEIIQYFRPIQKVKKLKNQSKTKINIHNTNTTKNTKKNVSRSRNKSNQGKNNMSVTNSRQKNTKNQKIVQKNSSSITSHSHKITINSTTGGLIHPNNTKSRTKSTTKGKSKQKKKQSSKSISKQKQKQHNSHSKTKENIFKKNKEQSKPTLYVQKNTNSNSRQRQIQQKEKKRHDISANNIVNGKELHSYNQNFGTNPHSTNKSKEKIHKSQYHQYQSGEIKSPMTNNAYANIGNLNIPHPRK